MKHRRFSFISTVIMMLALVALIATAGFWLEETLNLPNWVNPLIAMILMTASFEFAARFGPKEFDTPFSGLRQESKRDQFVMLVGCVAFVVIALPIGQGVFAKSGLATFGCLILGAGAFYAICFIGGSDRLRAQFKFRQPTSQVNSNNLTNRHPQRSEGSSLEAAKMLHSVEQDTFERGATQVNLASQESNESDQTDKA